MSTFRTLWTLHKWAGIVLSLVFLLLATTGFLLLVKKRVPWVQPPEVKGSARDDVQVSFEDLLAAARSDPRLGIAGWEDVDRIDVRPGKGMAKVQARNRYEAQVDLRTGALLQVAYRRSDLIESLHDGSFFGDGVHGFVMPLVPLGLLFLVGSGLYIWLQPIVRKRRKRRDSLRERQLVGSGEP